MRKSIAFLTIFIFLSATVPAYAQPGKPDITMSVSGLVCDFCARAIEHVFRKQAAVSDVNVDLDNGKVTLALKSGKSIDDKTLKKLMTDSGYTVTAISRRKGATHD